MRLVVLPTLQRKTTCLRYTRDVKRNTIQMKRIYRRVHVLKNNGDLSLYWTKFPGRPEETMISYLDSEAGGWCVVITDLPNHHVTRYPEEPCHTHKAPRDKRRANIVLISMYFKRMSGGMQDKTLSKGRISSQTWILEAQIHSLVNVTSNISDAIDRIQRDGHLNI
jgi:hypothetical protein